MTDQIVNVFYPVAGEMRRIFNFYKFIARPFFSLFWWRKQQQAVEAFVYDFGKTFFKACLKYFGMTLIDFIKEFPDEALQG